MNDNTKTCSSCFKDIDARALRCPMCTQRQPGAALQRDVPGKVLGGVTAAFAQHFNWDVTLVRVALIISVVFTGTLALWLYVAAWVVMPFNERQKAPLARFVDSLGRAFNPPPAELERVR